MRTFIFSLTEGVQVVIEAETFSEAKKEYDKVRVETAAEKIKIMRSPAKNVVRKGIYDYLLEIKEGGFFNSSQTLGDIKNKLAELTINCETTTLPPYLNKLIKEGVLKRSRGLKEGKEAWLYEKV